MAASREAATASPTAPSTSVRWPWCVRHRSCRKTLRNASFLCSKATVLMATRGGSLTRAWAGSRSEHSRLIPALGSTAHPRQSQPGRHRSTGATQALLHAVLPLLSRNPIVIIWSRLAPPACVTPHACSYAVCGRASWPAHVEQGCTRADRKCQWVRNCCVTVRGPARPSQLARGLVARRTDGQARALRSWTRRLLSPRMVSKI